MAQERARSRYLRLSPAAAQRRRELWALASRGAAFLVLLVAAAAAGLALAALFGGPPEAAAQTASAVAPGGAHAAHSWSELTARQKVMVSLALATVVASAAVAVTLARKRATARWYAACERRRLLLGAHRRPRDAERPKPKTPKATGAKPACARDVDTAPPPPSAPPLKTTPPPPRRAASIESETMRNEAVGLSDYLRELRLLAVPPGLETCGPTGDAVATAAANGPAPSLWRTAHARRRRRFERLRHGAALSFEAHETALRSRIVKLGLAETERRKGAEDGRVARR